MQERQSKELGEFFPGSFNVAGGDSLGWIRGGKRSQALSRHFVQDLSDSFYFRKNGSLPPFSPAAHPGTETEAYHLAGIQSKPPSFFVGEAAEAQRG